MGDSQNNDLLESILADLTSEQRKRETELRTELENRGKALGHSLQVMRVSRLKVAEILTTLREKILPKGRFDDYLKAIRFSRSTAYRAIKSYAQLKTLPPLVIETADRLAIDLTGERIQKAIDDDPRPKKEMNAPEAEEYVLGLDSERKRNRSASRKKAMAPDRRQAAAYAYVIRQIEGMPQSEREPRLEQLFGQILSYFAIQEMTIRPAAAPMLVKKPHEALEALKEVA